MNVIFLLDLVREFDSLYVCTCLILSSLLDCKLLEIRPVTFPPFCSHHLQQLCCYRSVSKSRPPLCDPTDWSTPGLPVPHCLPKFAQVHVHWVGGAIQPSHSLPPSFPFALNLSQHQDLNESALLIRWPKYWRFSLSIIPSTTIILAKGIFLMTLEDMLFCKSIIKYNKSKSLWNKWI